MQDAVYDLVIVGGGINGAGIAADAAGRGLKVLLAEMGDLAGATSSASSKLIHGGLRYLEHYEFRLVREALREREILLANAPHIIWPLRFVLPIVEGMRPAPMIRAGLFLYDHLARRQKIPRIAAASTSGATRLARALRSDLAPRLCILGLLGGRRPARCAQRACRGRQRRDHPDKDQGHAGDSPGGLWQITLDGDGAERMVAARALVNAAGPWARAVRGEPRAAAAGEPPPRRLRLVKGSHIVVPRIAGADDAYLMQSPDGRVVFALPFEESFTLIGTTDIPYSGDPAAVAISKEEESYLIDLANQFFRQPVEPSAIRWRYRRRAAAAGRRCKQSSAVSRDYRLDLEVDHGRPALLNVIGGKITTYRKLAEAALDRLAPYLPPMGPVWTARAPLPGGDVGAAGIDGFARDLMVRRRLVSVQGVWRSSYAATARCAIPFWVTRVRRLTSVPTSAPVLPSVRWSTSRPRVGAYTRRRPLAADQDRICISTGKNSRTHPTSCRECYRNAC